MKVVLFWALQSTAASAFILARGGRAVERRRGAAAAADDVAGAKAVLLERVAAYAGLVDNNNNGGAADGPMSAPKKVGGLLEAESFGALEASAADGAVREARAGIVAAIEALAAYPSITKPFENWKTAGACPLGGRWKLLFTNAADATFKKGKRGAATTSQLIDTAKGLFVNCVDFANTTSKLQGFRVEVEGDKLSDTEVQLLFRRVKLLRTSRFPRWFSTITIPLPPPRLLRKLGRVLSRGKADQSARGAGFRILYLDKDLRAHRTFDGLYFLQERA